MYRYDLLQERVECKVGTSGQKRRLLNVVPLVSIIAFSFGMFEGFLRLSFSNTIRFCRKIIRISQVGVFGPTKRKRPKRVGLQ